MYYIPARTAMHCTSDNQRGHNDHTSGVVGPIYCGRFTTLPVGQCAVGDSPYVTGATMFTFVSTSRPLQWTRVVAHVSFEVDHFIEAAHQQREQQRSAYLLQYRHTGMVSAWQDRLHVKPLPPDTQAS